MVPGCASILYSIGVCAISFDGPLTYLHQRGLRTLCAGRTGSDAFESAPPRKCVRPPWFHLLFKTESSNETFYGLMHYQSYGGCSRFGDDAFARVRRIRTRQQRFLDEDSHQARCRDLPAERFVRPL